MKKIYQNYLAFFSSTLLLIMLCPSPCFTQEKLSGVYQIPTRSVVPKNYSQRITNDRTPISAGVPFKSDLPLFIQKFSQDKSPLLIGKEPSLLKTGQPVQELSQPVKEIQKSSLSIQKQAAQQEINMTNSFCGDNPIGTDDQYVTAHDKVLTVAAPGFLMNDIDFDGEPLTATLIADGVDHGSLSAFPDGSFTYTPTAGFVGTDQFQYRMRDASSNPSEPITVTIEVREAGNRNPVGSNDSFGALKGTVLTIAAPGFLANDIDQDSDVLTATLIADGVDHGSLSAFPDGSFAYTPTPGFTGTDQFQYIMRDAEFNQSEPITVTIQVYEGNRSPVGANDLFGVVQNTSLTVPAPGFLMNDIDQDGDALTATLIVDGVDHGSLSAFPDGSFTYTPTAGFTGTDQFQYRMRDSEFNQSEPITVTFEVIGTGVLPIGFADNYKTSVGSYLSIGAPGFLLNDIDQNGEPLTATLIVDGVDHGSLSAFPDGSFTYTPTPGFTGTDQFQYRMRDASFNQSEAITVTIEVGETFNRTPVGSDDQFAALANTTLMIASPGFLLNDIDQDGDILTATIIVDAVDNGSLSAFPDGSFSYTPNPGFTGTDQFQYRMRDSEFNQSDPITVTIQVFEGNRVPSGTNDVFTLVKNTTLNIAAGGFMVNDYDPDGDIMTATVIVDGVDHGFLSAFPDGSFSYTPTAGFTGTDQFQYRMRDSESNQSEAVTVILEVIAPNEPPVAMPENITKECTGPSGTSVMLDGSNSSDPEGGNLTYTWYENNSIIAGPTTSPTSEVVFTTGVHQVTLKIADECGVEDEKEITVSITDLTGPEVTAAIIPAGAPNKYTISCNSADVCTSIISSSSIILAPNLINPSVSLKNKNKFSLEINLDKNTVSVEAPNAAAFWAMVLSEGGIPVNGGQLIEAKYDKKKFKYSFDATGKLLSVHAPVITLRCAVTDANGNTGVGETTLPLDAGSWITKTSPIDEGENSVMHHRNYPNPFTENTTIQFKLPEPAFVQITIFDVMGRVIDVLSNKHMEAGEHQVPWNAQKQKAGVYFYKIQYNTKQLTKKMLRL